jgi:hypothetical protein
MPVNWRATLPKPNADGYVLQPGDGREVSEMEQGPRRIRNRFVNVPSTITLPFIMTLAQLVEFEAFYETDINNGVDPFNIELMQGGVLGLKTVQIIARGQQTPMGGDLYQMSLQVETV